MTEIKRTMIASILIEQAEEMKHKRPTELVFEELVDVVQAIVKNCSIPNSIGQSEQLKCVHPFDKVYQSNTECYCEKCGKDLTRAF